MAVRQSSSTGKKPGVSHHAVLRPGAHPFDVPKAHQSFHGLDASESLVVSECIHQAFYLKHGRQIAEQYSARPESLPG
jgi:hypothetical protein